MNLFSKFRQWHNGGLVDKQPIKVQVKLVKPCIKSERLPSGILFWNIVNKPEIGRVCYSDWDAAYYWTTRRNQQEVIKWLAKKEKQK